MASRNAALAAQHDVESTALVCSPETEADEDVNDGLGVTPILQRVPALRQTKGTQVLPGLSGLVPRPLTLAHVVAEAITQAAYRQGSTDNLAALVVDLQTPWRSERTSKFKAGMSEGAGGGKENRHGSSGGGTGRARGGPELAGESADYMLPRHSTGVIIPQHGELLQVCFIQICCLGTNALVLMQMPAVAHNRDAACSHFKEKKRHNYAQAFSDSDMLRYALRVTCHNAGSSHVYKLEELVALVPRSTADAAVDPAWPGVCRFQGSELPQDLRPMARVDEVPQPHKLCRTIQRCSHSRSVRPAQIDSPIACGDQPQMVQGILIE